MQATVAEPRPNCTKKSRDNQRQMAEPLLTWSKGRAYESCAFGQWCVDRIKAGSEPLCVEVIYSKYGRTILAKYSACGFIL